MQKFVTLLLLLMLPLALFAQGTGHSDTFDGELVTTGPPTFDFTQEDGVLLVNVHKSASTTWQAITYDIGSSLDIRDNPYVLVRLKIDTPCVLSAYVMDHFSTSTVLHRKVNASDTYVTYFYDFSDKSGADRSIINRILLTPNGNTQDAFDANLYIDEIMIGSDALKMANIGAVETRNVYINSVGNSFKVRDLENVASLTAVSQNGNIENIQIGDINLAGNANILFDAVANVFGSDTVLVTAIGGEGYADNEISVPVNIEPNLPPQIDQVPDQQVLAGDTTQIMLTGISDGNATVNQSLAFTMQSSDQDAVPDSLLSIEHVPGNTVAILTLVSLQPAEDIAVTITLDDMSASDNTFASTFMVNVFPAINNAPVIDPIDDTFVYVEDGPQTLSLTGISDGDQGTQNLVFTVFSSDTTIIDNSLTIDYTAGETTAVLNFTPLQAGETTITITLQDDGGNENNNGDQSVTRTFVITVGNVPVTGHVANFSSFENWGVDALGSQQAAEIGTFKGRDNVLKLTLTEKSCWTGTMYHTPEMNVDEHRYISYDMYIEGGSFELPEPYTAQAFTHCYFWDDGWDANLDRNVEATHAQRKRVVGEKWNTVLMDFRSATGMHNSENKDINVKRIQKILLNYASEFTWPFPSDNGTVYISNLRIGSAVPDSLIPIIPVNCTVNPVANQVVYENSGARKVTVTGISAGKDNPATPMVAVTSSDTTVVPEPVIGELSDGSVDLTFTPVQDASGTAQITVTITAENSNARSTSFKFSVIEKEAMVTLELDRDTLFQEIRGFGTFQFSGQKHYLDLYTKDLGASAVRTGLIENQIEWANDNDDPNVLNLEAYDQNAFDFDYYRQLKENGVETFILTSWSPPAWMKRNLSVSYAYAAAPDYENTDNVLEPYYYEEFAESMVAAVKMFKINSGIDLYAVGPQNEPAFCEPYASAVLSPIEYAKLVTIIGKRFEAEGIDSKLYMPEQVFTQAHYSMEHYINSIKANSDADKYTDIIATHGYGTSGVVAEQPSYQGWSTMRDQAQACQYDKEMWMSETYPEYEDWDSAISLAGGIHGGLVWGNVSLWTLWNIEGTLINKGVPTASFYTSKNYYKYIRPGARRFRVYEDHSDILACGFIHPGTLQQTLVIINKGDNPLSLELSGSYHATSYDQYTTAKNLNFEYMGSVAPGGQVALPASSVTTLVGEIDGPVVTEVKDESLPQDFQLYQNYPNPFNPVTRIRFNIPVAAETSVKIYNVLGQNVRTLVDQTIAPGQHELIWDGLNDSNMQVSSGVYFYRIKSGNFAKTKKCILIR